MQSIRNRCRIAAAVVVVASLAATYAALTTYWYIKGIRADNKLLYEALVEQDAVLRGKYTTCERFLSDPVIKRNLNAARRRAG